MKKITVIYWVSTGLLCLAMGAGAVMDAIATPAAVKMVHNQLGYPVYFVVFIGIAKILACVALLVPGFNKLKEWAYAGFTFDLIGAAYSAIATGVNSGTALGAAVIQTLPLLIFFAVLALSYTYHHKMMAANNYINPA